MSEPVFSAPVETVRKRNLEATQRLLGDTIGMDNDQWRTPSLLPGWTRAHVAVHLARGADALVRLIHTAPTNPDAPMYPDPQTRFTDIERGVERSGLALQIDLDTSADELHTALDHVTHWTDPITLMGRSLTMAQVPMARLREVVLHHIDLACGFSFADIDPVPARWLLQWDLSARPTNGPRVRIASDSGITAEFGVEGAQRTVRGSDAHLWGWLTGRSAPDNVEGADGLQLPLL
jgi:maleylpyruvate isomerase